MSSSCDPVTCEQAAWLGAAGQCVESGNSTVCLCPPHYSGRDDWKTSSDCHVDTRVQRAFWAVNTVLAVLVFLCAFAGLAFLLSRWDVFWLRRHRAASLAAAAASTASPSHDEPLDARRRPSARPGGSVSDGLGHELAGAAPLSSRERRAQRRKVEREWSSLASIMLLLLFSINLFGYYVPFFLGVTRAERLWVQDLSMAFGTNSIFVGAWFFAYVWYINLPSLRLYGRLFGVDSVLIRHPNAVRGMIVARVVVINVVTLLLVFALERLGLAGQRDLLDSLHLAWCAIVTLDIFVSMMVLLRVVDRLFDQLQRLSAEARLRGVATGTESKAFGLARDTIRLTRRALTLLLVPGCILFALSAFLPFFTYRRFLFFNLNVALAELGSLVIVFLFVCRLKGEHEAPEPVRRQLDKAKSSALALAPATGSPEDGDGDGDGPARPRRDDSDGVLEAGKVEAPWLRMPVSPRRRGTPSALDI